MNWKTSITLVILAVLAAGWLWKGEDLLRSLSPQTASTDPAALKELETAFTTTSLTRIEVTHPGGDSFTFMKTENGWIDQGNWPLRKAEVNELVELLGTLRTRFLPIPLNDSDLAAFGLADQQKPIAVKVMAAGKEYALAFGEPESKPADSPFTRPAFARIGDAQEVLRLGPDVMPVLRRKADSYRRRQLFSDVERVKISGGPQQFVPDAPLDGPLPVTYTLPGLDIEEIRVTGVQPKDGASTAWADSGTFALRRIGATPEPAVTEKNAEASVRIERLADAWAVVDPVRGRCDPVGLRRALAAVADLWVEDFIPAGQSGLPERSTAIACMLLIPLEPIPGTLLRLHPKAITDPRDDIKKSTQSLSVTTKSGGTITVRFGGVAKMVEREEMITIPTAQGPRTIPQTTQTTYRYAQIEGNPQLFTVPADKFNDIFTRAGQLIDSRVARFNAEDVRRVTIERPGHEAIVLDRKKGNAKAASPEQQSDRWLIEQKPNPLPADAGTVKDFIERLAEFRGSDTTDLYNVDPKLRGLDPASCIVVTVVVREPRPEGEPDAPAQEYKLLIGTPDLTASKLPVQLAGWPRIALIPDRLDDEPDSGWLAPILFPNRLEPIFKRDAIAFRSRTLIDTTAAKLTGLAITGEKAFTLARVEQPGDKETWKLTVPVSSATDMENVSDLLDQILRIHAVEFIAGSAANPAEYGLEKPTATLVLTFDNGRSYRFEIGRPRPGKSEVFARLDGGAVFTLPALMLETINRGPLPLIDTRVWTVAVENITSAEITRLDRPDESFTLTKDGNNWKLTGPFTAPVSYLNAQPMLTQLGNLAATRYEALAVAEPMQYGFDKPHAKVKLAYNDTTGKEQRAVSRTLVIGGHTPGGISRYARFDEPNSPVFELPEQYLITTHTLPLALLDRNLLNLASARIAKIQIESDRPENTITLLKDEKGRWKAEGASFTVDELEVARLIDALAPLPVERLAAYGDAIKWEDYGLEKPAWTVTVTTAEEPPARHTIQLGKSAELGGRFVRVDGGKAVGVLPAPAVQLLARAKLDFADRTLLSFKPDELLGIARAKGMEELELVPGAGDGWDVVKPTMLKADRLLVEELADSLGKLRADRIVAFGKKEDVYKQFGLEPPEAAVTLTIGEKLETKVLRLGAPVDAAKPDGDRYASLEAAGADAAVGVLPAALATKLLAAPVSFRDRTIARFVDADQLVLERGSRTITFSKVAGNWKVTKPLTADAEQTALDELVNELAKLRAADWVSEKPTPEELKKFGLENPEAAWTVKNGDKVELVLRIGKAAADGRVYATAGTNGMVALLGKPQSAKVLGEYRVRKPWTLDAFQTERIEIMRGDKTFTLTRRGNTWSDPDAPNDAINPRAVTELLGALTAIEVDRFAIDADADLLLFGLMKPEVVITVTLADGDSRVLAIGSVVGGTNDTQRYARVVDKERTDVFVLTPADTERFLRGRAEYVQKK